MLARLSEQLRELSLDVEMGPTTAITPAVSSAPMRLARGGGEQNYRLVHGSKLGLTVLATVAPALEPTFLYTEFTSPRTMEALRGAQVQHLDMAGNAWIEFGDVLIDVRGRRRPSTDEPRHVGSSENLFSARRVQVIFALLAWPRLWDASRRDLARAAGVSLGQAQGSVRLLEEAGYGPRRMNAQQADLLSLWSAAYPSGLAKSLTLARYRGALGSLQKVNDEDSYFLSGESAVPELLPASLTLYVSSLDPDLALANRWRSDGVPNIVVRRQFWEAPAESSNYSGPLAGLRDAPWPLVYADLLSSDDPRARGFAPTWRQRHELT